MRRAIQEHGTLERLFHAGIAAEDRTVLPALARFVQRLRDYAGGADACASLLSSPEDGSACKRLNLYLRWMVRRDAVDPGPWASVSRSLLVVPLDTHMFRIARALGLTARNQANLKTAVEITSGFARFSPKDPVRYDFCPDAPRNQPRVSGYGSAMPFERRLLMDWDKVRSQYMVPPDIVYLNNGSFGPAPRHVFDALVRYMKQLEENPQIHNDQYDRMRKVVKPKLAAFVGCAPEFMAMVVNLTFGMNVISRGIRGLAPGDEILTTDQEYGAVNNIWDYAARKSGLVIRRVSIPVPPESPEQIVRIVEEGITPRTRLIYCSHITTTTGLVLPVKQICALARSRSILTAIDGAHAPGMIQVDINDIGCDFYAGNCHKWIGAPKGSAFIAMSSRSWDRVEPFLVGWGWYKDRPETFEGNFENPGVHNTAIHNAVGEAVDYQLSIGKSAIEARGRELAEYGKDIFTRMPGVKLLTPRDPRMCGSMAAFSLPPVQDDQRMTRVLKERGIVVPAGANSEGGRMRVSTHIFNSRKDVDTLADALREIYRA